MMTDIRDPMGGPGAARFLEAALLFTFLAHGLAMFSMAAWLLPGLPGGSHDLDAAARAGYVASHPWLWRMGWFPWQLTALSDLLLGLALLGTRWISRRAAVVTLLLTLGGIAFDQTGEALWMTRGIELARQAVTSGDLATYLRFEHRTFRWIAGWATVGYLAGALGWTWCFAQAGTWSGRLTGLSVAVWSIFAMVTLAVFVPVDVRPSPTLVSIGNAVGFVLLMVWFAEVTEKVLARARPAASHGRYARWKHPGKGWRGGVLTKIGNSHFLRALGGLLPTPPLASDITDVVYINYLVEAQSLLRFVPPGLELQRLGPGDRWAMFTALTYRHGRFGPPLLRRLLPSPIQSNWRIYVTAPATGRTGIYFLTTCIDSIFHALVARLTCEAIPMQVPHRAQLRREPSGAIRLLMEPGAGTCPDLRAELRPAAHAVLPREWSACFGSYREFLEYCVPQDRAMSSQPWLDRMTRQEIELGIAPGDCQPLEGTVVSHAAAQIAGTEPVSFLVRRVRFRFIHQRFEPLWPGGLPSEPRPAPRQHPA